MKIKSFYEGRKRLLLALIVIMGMVVILASVSFGNLRTTVPPDPYAPIYADWYGNEDWVTFIFYRSPDCVPDTFNLLNFFNIPNAWACPLTVEGFAIYKKPGDLSPIQAELQGLGDVPIWFVSREDYRTARSGGLFMPEFASMPSLIMGLAHFYKETLHSEGHPTKPLKNVVASGTLEENSSGYRFFRLHIIWVGAPSDPVINQVEITFW